MESRRTVLQLADELDSIFLKSIAQRVAAAHNPSPLITQWNAAIGQLRSELESAPISFEHYIADLVRGELTPTNCEYDVGTRGGIKLEVKWSKAEQTEQEQQKQLPLDLGPDYRHQ